MGSTPNNATLTSLEDLLAQSAWLRRIASALLGDQAAEDLSQDVLAEALRAKPALSGDKLRAWLLILARRMAARSRWRSGMRPGVEKSVARTEAIEPDPSRRLELHRKLAEAISQLESPYREALVLRYFEGLAPRQMAQRLDLPVTTVSKRVSRGLAQLRQRLDADFEGGRAAWGLAFLPFARSPVVASANGSASVGAVLSPVFNVLFVLMIGKLMLFLAAVLLVFVGWNRWLREDASSEVAGTQVGQVGELLGSDVGGPKEPQGNAQRMSIPLRALAQEVLGSSGSRGDRLHVTDAAGLPLAEALVAWIDADSKIEVLELDDQGAVPLPAGFEFGRFYARAKGLAGGFVLGSERDDEEGLCLPLGELRSLAGVLIEDGAFPTRSWTLIRSPKLNQVGFTALEGALAHRLARTGAFEYEELARTAKDGSFEFHHLSPGQGGYLRLPPALVQQKVNSSATGGAVAFYRAEDTQVRLGVMLLPFVEGRIVWEETGEPLIGELMSVLYEGSGQNSLMETGRIDGEGYFQIGLPLKGSGLSLSFKDRAAHLVHSRLRVHVTPSQGPDVRMSFPVSLEGQVFPLDMGELRVKQPAARNLRVVGPTGLPLANAAIASVIDSVVTDADGRARLGVTPLGTLFVLASGHAVGKFSVGDLSLGVEGSHELRLELGHGLSIRVPSQRDGIGKTQVKVALEWERTPFGEGGQLNRGGAWPYSHNLRARFQGVEFLKAYKGGIQSSSAGALSYAIPSRGSLEIPGLLPGSELKVQLIDFFDQALATQRVRVSSTPGMTPVDLTSEKLNGSRLRLGLSGEFGQPVFKGGVVVRSDAGGQGHYFPIVDGVVDVGIAHHGTYSLSVHAEGFEMLGVVPHEHVPGARLHEIVLRAKD